MSIVGDLGLDFEELGNVLEEREEHDERDVLDGARTVAERVADGLVSVYWTEETIIPKSRSSSISQIEFRECAENKKRGKDSPFRGNCDDHEYRAGESDLFRRVEEEWIRP